MATLLYTNFLHDTSIYDAAEAFWKTHFDELAEAHGFSYHPYINTIMRSGRKLYDGNPIYSALAPTLNRGVRIIQEEPEEGEELYISGWLDTMELSQDRPPINELVIALILSEETQPIAAQWIQAWVVEQVSAEEMDKLIAEQMVLVQENE